MRPCKGMKDIYDWYDSLEELREWTKTEMMNEERAQKLRLLVDMICDILLEEDLTQIAFKEIRGHAVKKQNGKCNRSNS